MKRKEKSITGCIDARTSVVDPDIVVFFLVSFGLTVCKNAAKGER